jgi:hypothetical protein
LAYRTTHNFLGLRIPRPLQSILCRVEDPAARIKCVGLSIGDDVKRLMLSSQDYLYQLEKALQSLSSESGDEHVYDLARRCREVEARASAGVDKMQHADVVGSELKRVGSTDEQEEVEK